jgi:orotidine-5'-phosphate decarboxylase
VGVPGEVPQQVSRLAALAVKSGCKGIVSSAKEVAELRRQLRGDVVIVTPGVRPAGASHGDQARVVTPAQAIAAGASHIVVGRPITEAADPAAAAKAIVKELAGD